MINKKEYFPVGDANLPPQKKDLIRKEIDKIRQFCMIL